MTKSKELKGRKADIPRCQQCKYFTNKPGYCNVLNHFMARKTPCCTKFNKK